MTWSPHSLLTCSPGQLTLVPRLQHSKALSEQGTRKPRRHPPDCPTPCPTRKKSLRLSWCAASSLPPLQPPEITPPLEEQPCFVISVIFPLLPIFSLSPPCAIYFCQGGFSPVVLAPLFVLCLVAFCVSIHLLLSQTLTKAPHKRDYGSVRVPSFDISHVPILPGQRLG
jgi:hypothetical protein